jgi:hypothetical protein
MAKFEKKFNPYYEKQKQIYMLVERIAPEFARLNLETVVYEDHEDNLQISIKNLDLENNELELFSISDEISHNEVYKVILSNSPEEILAFINIFEINKKIVKFVMLELLVDDYFDINYNEDELLIIKQKVNLDNLEYNEEDEGEEEPSEPEFIPDYPILKIFENPGSGDFVDTIVYGNKYPELQSDYTYSPIAHGETWFPISNITEFQNINNNLSRNYYLTQDIDASITSEWNSGSGFLPIGNNSTKFTGDFDGCNFTIYGLFINRTGTDYVGIFGSANTSSIKNLILDNCNISGKQYCGILTGEIRDSTVENCHITNSFLTGTRSVGNIYGRLWGTNEFSYCTILDSSMEDTGSGYSGGFGGTELGGGSYNNCYIKNCILSLKSFSGGFIGSMESFGTTNIENCFSDVSISAGASGTLGGFVGRSYKNGVSIQNCYSLGSIVSTGGTTGGFIGQKRYTGVIQKCYASVEITSDSITAVGGFIGAFDSTDATVGCYWNTEVSGKLTSADASEGKTTSELKTQNTFVNWDFTVVWEINQEIVSTISWIPISTTGDIQLIGNDVAYPVNGYYYLTNDIDFSSVESLDPIGFVTNVADLGEVVTKAFQGEFDGNGYKISNVTISKPANAAIGLFGIVLNGTIQNLGIENISVNAFTTAGALAGAIVGNCSIRKCYSTGEVTTTYESQYYTSAGLVSASDNTVGGTRVISDCYSSCVINGYDLCGITGFLAENTSVDNCYFAGELVYNNNTGYKNGISKNAGNVTSCYWDTETTGIEVSESGTGKTTEEMKTEETYIDWDFIDTWEIPLTEIPGIPVPVIPSSGGNHLLENGNTIKLYKILEHITRNVFKMLE